MQFKKITDVNLNNKVVFIRTDMNVPIQNGYITDDTRILASLTTLKYALERGAKIIIATHLGRPTEGKCNSEDSVSLVAQKLGNLLGYSIPIIEDLTYKIDFTKNPIVMLENVRCNIGEKNNSDELGKHYAALCDIFVHDAFAAAHRAESSTDAIGKYAKEVCAGLLMTEELDALTKAIAEPQNPVVAIVGGSKVSTKLTILDNLADKVDYLIVGGGILNTFLVAAGFNVAKSLYEPDLVSEAKILLQKMQNNKIIIPLPEDVVVASEFAAKAKATTKNINDLSENDMILDIGQQFAKQLADIIKKARTIIWNGPIGVFEFDQFSYGTQIIAESIANSDGYSLAGGGDTIAAINKFNLFKQISYVSTAGGALLEFLEGKKLPAIKMLESRI